ncbi:hypothetical protein [Sorangium sp. So ce124]|uniref:hypothetical protein n=1 Tax=Sorangium sp. So ce124 TaxID=3133280 RepID=UPI003F6162D4
MSPRAWVGAVALGFAAFSSSGCGRSQAPAPDRAAPDVSGVAAAPGASATAPGAVTEAPEVATAPGTAAPPGAAPAPAQPASAAPSAQPASAAPSMGAAGIRKPSPGARGPSPDAKPKLKCGRTYCNAAGECFAPSPPQCE